MACSLRLRRDPRAVGKHARRLPRGFWVHPGVGDGLKDWPHLRNRVGLVLRHLAAHGRTTVVKSCQGNNRGWRRSPLGGGGGMQYYLWWTPQGSAPTHGFDFPTASRNGILARAVRHHDDNGVLGAGQLDDYFSFCEIEEDEGFVGCSWTPSQLRFVNDDSPVRLVHGRPGSGKTTALWQAIEARSKQSVLYLTWSRELATIAGEHFRAFAPADVQVATRDFTTFLGEVRGDDVSRRTLAESRAVFAEAVSRLSSMLLGPWAGRLDALHAELRAMYIGRAVPGKDNCHLPEGGLARLSCAAYRDLRAGPRGVGRQAADALLQIARTVEPAVFTSVFPELAAAADSIERMRSNNLPEGVDVFDRVVVDEVQDLTLIEIAAVVELCLVIARRRGHVPWLLLAGDAGQTVRPSGFDWGPLKDLLTNSLNAPRDFPLDDNLRCPVRIADVVERASKLYADLPKELKPAKLRRQSGGRHVDAHLVHVHITDTLRAAGLLEQLDELEGVVVISPDDRVPAWVSDHLRGMVLTPETAKGLEYQAVCVLDPGTLLLRFDAGAATRLGDDPDTIVEHAHRTAIDQLRVALSRATETLAFIDVAADDSASRSRRLLGEAVPYSPDDLVEHLRSDAPTGERVSARTSDARSLVDNAPQRAWQRACQALRLLGDPTLPNGVSDQTVRRESRITLLATAARLLVDGVPAGVHRDDVTKTAREAIEQHLIEDPVSSDSYKQAFHELDKWTRDRTAPPFPLLEAVVTLGRDDGAWVRDVLPPVAQSLRSAVEGCAAVPDTAICYAGDVEGWLELTNYRGAVKARSRALRRQAVNTLVDAARLLVDTAPQRAWQRARQALLLLDPALPNGVADQTVRQEARIELLATAARLLVGGVPADVRREDVAKTACEAIEQRLVEDADSSDGYKQAFEELDKWTRDRTVPPFPLLEAVLALGRDDGVWLRDALSPVSRSLRSAVEECASLPDAAAHYGGNVEGWLELTGCRGDVEARSRVLRCKAVDLLIEAGRIQSAERVLRCVTPADLHRTGRLHEAAGRPAKAAETFERARLPADALRNWRKAGHWEQVVRLAARLLVDGVPAGVHRDDVTKTAREAIEQHLVEDPVSSDSYMQAFHELDKWTSDPDASSFPFLEAVLALGPGDGGWLRDALLPVVQDEDLCRFGRLCESDGRPAEAADVFEWARLPTDALRNLRTAGRWEQLVRLAARVLVSGVPPSVDRADVATMAHEAIEHLPVSSARCKQAFHELDKWTRHRTALVFPLLEAVLALGRDDGVWVRHALPPVAPLLRIAVETCAAAPDTAAHYTGDVEGWLELTGYAGDAAVRSRELRCQAVDTLIESGEMQLALPCTHIIRSGQLQHAPVFQCGSRWLRWTFVRNRAT